MMAAQMEKKDVAWGGQGVGPTIGGGGRGPGLPPLRRF